MTGPEVIETRESVVLERMGSRMRDTSAVRPGRGGVSQLPAGRAGAGPRVAAHSPARPAFPLRPFPAPPSAPGHTPYHLSARRSQWDVQLCARVCTCVRCARVYVRNGPRDGGGRVRSLQGGRAARRPGQASQLGCGRNSLCVGGPSLLSQAAPPTGRGAPPSGRAVCFPRS